MCITAHPSLSPHSAAIPRSQPTDKSAINISSPEELTMPSLLDTKSAPS